MSLKFNPDFELTEEIKKRFAAKGFVKLEGLFIEEPLSDLKALVHAEMGEAVDIYATDFSGLKFDICTDEVAELIAQEGFTRTMRELTERRLFFTQGIGFWLAKLKDRGLPWHIGIQSFGFQRGQDFACSLWVPLDPIVHDRQGGGMAYVPANKLSGRFLYDSVDPAMTRCLRDMAQSGVALTGDDFLDLRDAPLNNPEMNRALEFYKEVESYSVGDAMLFDKYVIHRSCRLGEGPLDSRTAFVMRFIDTGTRYDFNRVEDQEFFKDYLGVSGSTNFNREICREDGALLIDSPWFSDREARVI